MGEIAAPADQTKQVNNTSKSVSYFGVDPDRRIGYAPPDLVAADSFRKLLQKKRPGVVHLHARTASVSALLLEVSRDYGAKTVVTYHTPTVSCIRGTMMRDGAEVCDGTLDAARCASCALTQYKVPNLVADILAHTPASVGKALSNAGIQGGVALPLQMRQIVERNHEQFFRFMSGADRVVAVCDWVAGVLRRNGVQAPKLVLNRQGVSRTNAEFDRRVARSERELPLKLGYFGRVHPTKGLDTLVRALGAIPDAQVSLDIFGVVQEGNQDFYAQLKQLSASDARIRFRPPVDASSVSLAMSEFDIIAVPSVWLETGPLVVLEAFAAGVPVIGARLGGIAELVEHEVDGILVPPKDVSAWAEWIAKLSSDRAFVRSLMSSVKPPRTMTDVAREMAHVYNEIVS